MRFARWVFLLGGIYGLLILTLGLLLGERLQPPPGITHPEFFYGLFGSEWAWQLVFLLTASAPGRFRVLMPLCVIDKLVFPTVCVTLVALGRLAPGGPLYPSLVDAGWAAVFAVAYVRTPANNPA